MLEMTSFYILAVIMSFQKFQNYLKCGWGYVIRAIRNPLLQFFDGIGWASSKESHLGASAGKMFLDSVISEEQ